MSTTLQINRPAAPAPAPAPEGIEWAIPAVDAPADKRLDPRPATEGSGTRLSPFGAVSGLRRSMSARRARRIANRPELESVFPAGHPGFELRTAPGETRSALVAPAAAPVPVTAAAATSGSAHAYDAIDLDFTF